VIFELFNNNCSLFYIAFFRQDMALLRSTLLSLLIVFQVVFQLIETAVPSLLDQYRLEAQIKQMRAEFGEDAALYEEDVSLQKEDYESFDDFLEMAVQFGHVTLFVSAFPLSPLCALVNNLTEIRLDAFKLLSNCARPTPKSANSIGAWETVLQAIAVLAVFTNVGTVVFTSSQVEELLPGCTFSTKLIIFLVAEQAILLTLWLVETQTPDVPEDVTIAIERQQYQKEKALLSQVAGTTERDESQPPQGGATPSTETSKTSGPPAIVPSSKESPRWIDDNEAPSCLKCGSEFGMFLRRHHCRNCGKIFCNTCCPVRSAVPADSTLLSREQTPRVCTDCYKVVRRAH